MKEVTGKKSEHPLLQLVPGRQLVFIFPSSTLNPPHPQAITSTSLSGLPGSVAQTLSPLGSEALSQDRVAALVHSWSQPGKRVPRGAQANHKFLPAPAV